MNLEWLHHLHTQLTNNGALINAESADAGRTIWDGELAETPFAGKILGQEVDRSQARLLVQFLILEAKHVDRAVVRSHAYVGACLVEVDAIYCGLRNTNHDFNGPLNGNRYSARPPPPELYSIV